MSRIDAYISKLMGSDEELQKFLIDPIRHAQDDNGLTKGERSVIRRVLAGISHNATNGMSLHRSLNSYRRSLRLLQNVLHVHSGSVLANHVNAQAGDGTTTFTVKVYFGPYFGNPGFLPYATYIVGTATLSTGSYTISEVMQNVPNWYTQLDTQATLSYNDGPVITEFTVNFGAGDVTYTAVPGDPKTSTAPFWFYSVDGTALDPATGYTSINPMAQYGHEAYSYQNFSVDADNDTIFWQCIAPGTNYGFQSCAHETFNS
ncbi:MAG: hypothetical protein AAF998_06710 [Bacteroidota bacterium]